MESKSLYEQWKATAKYSEQHEARTAEEKKFQTSAGVFFAAAEPMKPAAQAPKEPLEEKYKRQFKMDVQSPGTFLSQFVTAL